MNEPHTGPFAFDIAAREAQVIGEAQRVIPLNNEEIGEEERELVARIRESAGADRAAVMPEYMRTVLKHPEIFRCQMEMGTALFKGAIPARERELAILRIGWLCRAPYEWGQHVDIAKRHGIVTEEIERVTQGSAAVGWTAHERAVLRGVEELLADQTLSDATWDALAESWNDQQLIEFPMMVGQYVATAYLQNTLRIRLSPGNPGFANR